MAVEILDDPRLKWLSSDKLKPYVYVRPENRIQNPGQRFKINWFNTDTIYKNPLCMEEVDFADQIMRLESRAFAATNMPMPRWVFYDCAIMPGFVAGFAMHRSQASKEILNI